MNFNRREFLEVAGSALAAPLESAQGRGPNIVYVLSDTHRWGAMPFTQTPGVRTPSMDRLRQEGVSFNHCYTNLPICTPYRAIMMTGRWPYQQGLMENHMKLAERVDMPEGNQYRGTLAWTFKDAGYRTAHFGKWHLGGADTRRFGFDKSVVWEGTNNHRKCSYSVDGGPLVAWQGESNATATTEQALEWMEQVSRGPEPFLLVISLNPPHGPVHDASDRKKALYPSEKQLPFHPLDKLREWEAHRDYHAWVSAVDDDLGLVMRRLETTGLAKDTVLIYTSDHGGMSGVDGVEYGQKRHPNDESSRVPFLIRWPGHIPAGRRFDDLISTIDVVPTLAGLGGVGARLARGGTSQAKESAAYLASLPGHDFSLRLMGSEDKSTPESVFLMHPSNMNNANHYEPIWRAVVTREFTYAVTGEGEHRLWKNGDGYQKDNLLGNPAYLDTRRELWRKLDGWMDRVERPYYDNWFARAAEKEVKAWNREHGFGKDNPDRLIGRKALFDMSKSKPA